jgi:hypothetical protein
MAAQSHTLHAGPSQVLWALARIGGEMASLLLVYFMLPLNDRDNAVLGLVTVAVGLTVFVAIFVRQLRKIRSAEYPILRAVEAIAVVATIFVILMAGVAIAFATADPNSYSEDMSRLDGLYFTVTTLATVGFGDITPTSDASRAFTTFQIVLGVALLGAGVRVLLGVAQRVADDRRQVGEPDSDEAA